MQTIQVVIDEQLLTEADAAAERLKVNRSALIREALRNQLKVLAEREKEKDDREGYRGSPSSAELAHWERESTWPVE